MKIRPVFPLFTGVGVIPVDAAGLLQQANVGDEDIFLHGLAHV